MKCYQTIAFTLVVVACQKHSPAPAIQNKEIASFNVGNVCWAEVSHFVDSTLQFNNLSHLQDTAAPARAPSVSFHWDFGDQTTSTDKAPTHQYHLPGTYTVTLTTYLDNQPSDTVSEPVQIIMGLRELKMLEYTLGIDMDQATQNGALALYESSTGNNDWAYGLIRVDSLLNVRWTKTFPGDINTVRLSSIERVNDNAYILSGNYSAGNVNGFCLSEIDSSGNLIWMNPINNLTGTNTYTLPLAGGGFLTLGNISESANYYTAIVKCDASGNELWRKVFDTGSTQPLIWADNILELPGGGYAFAAQTAASYPNIDLVLTEMDVNGNIETQKTITPVSPAFASTTGVLYNSNTYLVYVADETYFYLFDNNLSYTGNQPFAQSGIRGGFNAGSNFVVYTYTSQYSFLDQLLPGGSAGWTYLVDNDLYPSCISTLMGATRFCRKAVNNGEEIILFADGQNLNNTEALYIAKLTPDGKLK